MAKQIKFLIIVGTEEELATGKGEPAITLTDAASQLGFSEPKLRSMIRDGTIVLAPVGSIGKRMLFRSSDINKLRG